MILNSFYNFAALCFFDKLPTKKVGEYQRKFISSLVGILLVEQTTAEFQSEIRSQKQLASAINKLSFVLFFKLQAKAEAAMREKQASLANEDLSDMVAEHAAKQSNKRKRQAGKEKEGGGANKKYKEFKL